MALSLEYGALDERALPELARILSWSFGFPADGAEPWLRSGGLDNVRVLRRGAAVDACLLLIPQAQFVGGESVPSVGVAGVATRAEARGTGAAVELMREALRELHAAGVAISTLYPATLPLYRRVGYEIAGLRHEVTVRVAELPKGSRELPIREIGEGERDLVKACYAEAARAKNGWLDRGPYVWRRVFEPRGEHPRAFVVGDRGEVLGYVVVYEKRGGSLEYSLVATDLVARTPAALARLFTFLADHGTLADTVTWYGGPSDERVLALPAVGYATRVQHAWMTRLVDVPKALEARGFAPGLSASIDLDVTDDLLPDNAGRFVLTVEGGRASVARGGRGELALDVGALAALYTGHATPRALAAAGAAAGEDAALARAEAIFAAPAPSLADFF